MSKKYFYSVGQQLASCSNRSGLLVPQYRNLPTWAKDALTNGFIDQLKWPGVEQRKSEMAAYSMVQK